MQKNKVQQVRILMIYLFPLLSVLLALFIGRYPTSTQDVVGVFSGLGKTNNSVVENIILNIRLSRALVGFLTGGALAISGAVLQGIFKNPLVDSGMLGVSNGASFGAVLGFLFFGGKYSMVLGLSFAFGVLAVYLSYSIAGIYKSSPTIMLVLGGVIVSSMFSSLVSLGKYIADPYDQLPAIVFWLMGSLSGVGYGDVRVILLPVLVAGGIVFLLRWKINVLSLGEREASSLGINVRNVKGLLIICVSVMTASVVSISGTIGWVGLIVPHLVRMLLGNDHRRLVPASFAFGGGLLVAVDIVARSLTTSEIPIGILTALLGAPFYVVLLRQTKGRDWQ